jgi:hypothetical protein
LPVADGGYSSRAIQPKFPKMTPASDHPSVLLLDDGELDVVHAALERLGADVARIQGDDIGPGISGPRDLLIASARRCIEMPMLRPADDASTPNWVCFHSQDFLPLRERLRDVGVHFLVHSSLDRESLRLFLLQMLYGGPERRRTDRLQVGTEAFLLIDGNRKPVRLAELSAESCRILSRHRIEELDAVQLDLCEAVAGGEKLTLDGVAIRTASGRSASGAEIFSTVVCLESLDLETRLMLERIVSGTQIGTPVSPLAGRGTQHGLSLDPGDARDDEPPVELASELEQAPPPPDRRESARHEYERRVEVVELSNSNTDGSGLGRDLSLTGIRVAGYPEMDEGAELTLALYGGNREEPVVVRAQVARGVDGDEIAFRFGALSESQHRGIAKLMAGQPPVASVDAGDRVVVTRIVDSES